MSVNHTVGKQRGSTPNFQNALHILCILCMAALCLTVIGLVIVVPLCVGLYLSVKAKNPASVTTSTRVVQSLLLVCAVGAGGMALYHSYKSLSAANKVAEFERNFPHKEELAAYDKFSAIDLYRTYGVEAAERIAQINGRYTWQLNDLSSDVRRNRNEAFTIGIVSAAILAGILLLEFGWRRPLSAKVARGELALPAWAGKKKIDRLITGKEGFTSYSVADELLKWNALKNNGTITESEYQAARKRLLGT